MFANLKKVIIMALAEVKKSHFIRDRTVSVIFSDSPYKDDKDRLTTVPLIPLSDPLIINSCLIR